MCWKFSTYIRYEKVHSLSPSATRPRAQVESLTPALLAKAFRGELVPQDRNDEPASVLLERIQAERAAGEEQKARKAGRV